MEITKDYDDHQPVVMSREREQCTGVCRKMKVRRVGAEKIYIRLVLFYTLFIRLLGLIFRFEKVFNLIKRLVFAIFFLLSIFFFLAVFFFLTFEEISKLLFQGLLRLFCLIFNLFVVGFEKWEKDLVEQEI